MKNIKFLVLGILFLSQNLFSAEPLSSELQRGLCERMENPKPGQYFPQWSIDQCYQTVEELKMIEQNAQRQKELEEL